MEMAIKGNFRAELMTGASRQIRLQSRTLISIENLPERFT